MNDRKVKKLHAAAELAAYKTGVMETPALKKQEEKYLRLAAEFDNYRKRTARQFTEIVRNANEELILELLDVLDDFQRGLDTLSSDKDTRSKKNRESLLAGMKMVYDKLFAVLKNRGVKPVEAMDKQFDPRYHEAVMQSPSDREEGTVIEVISPGYMLNDRVIRHAKVIVASSKTD